MDFREQQQFREDFIAERRAVPEIVQGILADFSAYGATPSPNLNERAEHENALIARAIVHLLRLAPVDSRRRKILRLVAEILDHMDHAEQAKARA